MGMLSDLRPGRNNYRWWRTSPLYPAVLLLLPLLVVPVRTDFASDVSSDIERVLECRQIAGLSVAVFRGNETLLAQGYGMADIANGVSMTADTPIPIGSLTKAFTVEILAQLLTEDQEHGYTWDTPLWKLLKDFRLSTPRLTSEVTLRDILAHRTGIPSPFLPIKVGMFLNTTRDDFMRMTGYFCPQMPFRHQYLYNNHLYVLAGYIAEVLAGDVSWEELVRQRIFGPLGMHSSSFADREPMPAGLAKPYSWNGSLNEVDLRTLLSLYGVGPAGSISSTANDMTAWMKYILGRASQWKPRTIYEIFQPQMVWTPKSAQFYKPTYPITYTIDNYGMGWGIINYRGYHGVFHSGLISTYSSRLAVLPGSRVAVFVSSNGPRPSRDNYHGMYAIMLHLIDHALGLEPWLAGDGLCTYPMPWGDVEPNVPITPRQYEQNLINKEVVGDLDLHPYEGTYINPGFGTVHIGINSADGRLHFRWGRLGQGKLYRIESSDHQDSVVFQVLWGAPFTYDTTDEYTMVFNISYEGGVAPGFGIPQGSTVDYFVRYSLFAEHDWSCPNVGDTYQCNGFGTTVIHSLAWVIVSSGIICTHILLY